MRLTWVQITSTASKRSNAGTDCTEFVLVGGDEASAQAMAEELKLRHRDYLDSTSELHRLPIARRPFVSGMKVTAVKNGQYVRGQVVMLREPTASHEAIVADVQARG